MGQRNRWGRLGIWPRDLGELAVGLLVVVVIVVLVAATVSTLAVFLSWALS